MISNRGIPPISPTERHEIENGVEPAEDGRELNVLIVLPAAKVSEPRLAHYVQLPRARVLLVGDESRAPAFNLVRFRAWRVPFLGALGRWTGALSWYRGLKSFIPGPVDCVISFEVFSLGSLQANQLAKRLGVPHIVTVAEVLTRSFFSVPPWRAVAAINRRSADAYVCSVELARAHAIAQGCPPERCVVMSPGVDLDLFTPNPQGRTREPVLLFIGEMRPDKGIREVMAAAERAHRHIPDLRLVIAGDGPLRHEVQEKAARLGFIDYRGKIPRNELPDLYRSARCFILAPSTRPFWAEQFGFASVEAMAAGLPVVITDSGAVRDVVPPWNPICPRKDVAALSEGIIAALGPEGDAWGACNRETAERQYDDVKQAALLRDWLGAQVASRQ